MPDRRPDFAGLPYGARTSRSLGPLYAAFRLANRWYAVPAIKLGLAPFHGNPLTGSWLLLRTVGRRTGRRREVPLGYAIEDGAVYVSAGFGPGAYWFRNIQADPRVEVVLPSFAFAGLAEEVTDPDELLRGWRALVRALGPIGRVFVCAPTAPDDLLVARTAGLPLVRIRPTGIAAGPADPGGLLWLTLLAAVTWLVLRRRQRPRAIASAGHDEPFAG
jgi:deazaflavin-dependent oxidoreductase (nitroreductase family)